DRGTVSHKTKGGEQKWRCTDCNAFRGKRDRWFRDEPILKAEWQRMPVEKRNEWINEHRDHPEGLLSALQTKVCETQRTHESEERAGSGTYFDEADIREKYKRKPDVAQSIIDNADRFVCQVAKRTMFEDIDYTRVRRQGESKEKVRSMELATEQSLKKQKIGRELKDDGGPADGADVDGRGGRRPKATKSQKPLTEQQKGTLQKSKDVVTKLLATLSECIKKADEENELEYIPKYVATGCAAAVTEANVVVSDIDVVLAEGREQTPEFKLGVLTAKISVAKTKLKEMHRRMLVQREEAAQAKAADTVSMPVGGA
ncbi:unnamed protein product, partial [Prorocentrum cordatum]